MLETTRIQYPRKSTNFGNIEWTLDEPFGGNDSFIHGGDSNDKDDDDNNNKGLEEAATTNDAAADDDDFFVILTTPILLPPTTMTVLPMVFVKITMILEVTMMIPSMIC